jgi:RNA polymerase sigma-70 factor, ECF subfamily
MTAAEPDRFDEVLGPLLRRGYLLAVTMLENREAAEDAVQEASVKAWRKLGGLRDPQALEAWYLSIVANQCRSARRVRWWSVPKIDAAEGVDRFDEDRAVASLDLDRALGRLDPEDRTALFLHYYLDLTFEQVGQVLGLSMTAARSRIYRLLARLKPGLALTEEGANG